MYYIEIKEAGDGLIFGPATLLFVGHRAFWPCSLLTPRARSKPLAAPSALIYEMASNIIFPALTPGNKKSYFKTLNFVIVRTINASRHLK